LSSSAPYPTQPSQLPTNTGTATAEAASNGSTKSLPIGVGLGVGIPAVIAIAGLLYFLRRRSQKAKGARVELPSDDMLPGSYESPPVVERVTERPTKYWWNELDGNSKKEPVEMPAN
jgi:hypothetical protein